MKAKIRELINPIMQKQTLQQLNQMKLFVDTSLKEAASKNFDSETEKIKYLLDTLYNIRDFVLAQTTENSVRMNLIKQFNKIEEEQIMGNDQQLQSKESLKKTEEKLAKDPTNLEINEG